MAVIIALLLVGTFLLIGWGVKGYREDACVVEYLWAVMLGCAVNWIAGLLWVMKAGNAPSLIAAGIALGSTTFLAIGTAWEVIRMTNTWGSIVVEKLGYPILTFWAVANIVALILAAVR